MPYWYAAVLMLYNSVSGIVWSGIFRAAVATEVRGK
jgi:hypothetical protein